MAPSAEQPRAPASSLGIGEASDAVDSWLAAAWGKKIGISNPGPMEMGALVELALAKARIRPLGSHFCKALRIRCKFVKEGESSACASLEPILCALSLEGLINFESDMGVRNEGFAHWAAKNSLSGLMAAIAKADPVQFEDGGHYPTTPLEAGIVFGTYEAMVCFIELCDPELGLIWARHARGKIVARLGVENEHALRSMRLEAKAESRLVGAAAGGASSGSSMRI